MQVAITGVGAELHNECGYAQVFDIFGAESEVGDDAFDFFNQVCASFFVKEIFLDVGKGVAAFDE